MTPIERSKALLAEATPSPWVWWTSSSWRRLSHDADGDVICPVVSRSDGHPDLEVSEPDMALIAALRNAAPALIEFVELSVAMEKAKWMDLAGCFDSTKYTAARNQWLAALARLTKDEEQL